MTFSINLRQSISLSALTVVALAVLGCASATNKKQLPSIAEEAYIDLKQGFSLVVPATWERERIPVSSPRHRPNTVEWLITSTSGPQAIFQVSVQNSLPLQEYLTNLDNGRFKLTKEMSKSLQHPAGPALRWESEDNRDKIILLIIEGPKRSYIITGKIAAVNYDQVLPTLEKVISSFSILQN